MADVTSRFTDTGWILLFLTLLYNTALYLPTEKTWQHQKVHYPAPLRSPLQHNTDPTPTRPITPIPSPEPATAAAGDVATNPGNCTDHVVFTIYMCEEKKISCDTTRKTIEANSREIWSYLSNTTNQISFLDFSSYNIRRNKYNVPILRSMYKAAMKICPAAATYTYVNADLLPQPGMLETINAVQQLVEKPYVLVGRRTNVDWLHGKHVTGKTFDFAAYDTGQQFWSNAQDYFVVSRNAINWDRIPDFVIGRVGYDNWLVDHLYHDPNVILVDVSRTMRMLHQTDKGGNQAGRFTERAYHDRFFNYPLAHNHFDHGTTDDAKWYTERGDSGTVVVHKVLPGRKKRSTSLRILRFYFNMS